MGEAAILAAADVLLEQVLGQLGGEPIELLHGPDQIVLAAVTSKSGVKVDAGQRVAKGIDALPQRSFRQRQAFGLAGHAER